MMESKVEQTNRIGSRAFILSRQKRHTRDAIDILPPPFLKAGMVIPPPRFLYFTVHSRFFFEARGAKKKLSKRNAKKSFALCGARQGLRALDRAAF
jgi:hypothetical protein